MRRYLLFSVLCFALVGCGIKPSNVSSPEGKENSQYPATYPKPEVDE